MTDTKTNTAAALVLIVEDDPKIAAVLRDYLAAAGYRTAHLDDGAEVEPFVRRHDPALVLLDLRLPGKGGLEVCRDLRQRHPVPVIMVTALVEEVDRLLGLEFGAMDYICKPFSPREVVARVRAQLRSVELARHGVEGKLGPFRLDSQGMRVELRGRPLELTPSEFRMLERMLLHPGRVFSRAQLLDSMPGAGHEAADRVVDTHVKNVRKKLAVVDPDSSYLSSVYGVGYKIEL